MKNSILKPRIARVVGSACAAFLLCGALTSCSDDLLTGQPTWLGESIYDELKARGNYSETLKLIDVQDEDYKSVLEKTGSKTLFVADDAAWGQFYKNNPWGARSLDELTTAQKRLLFKSSMINSAYLIDLLGNLPSATADEEPKEGGCLRRSTSINLMDSVTLLDSLYFPVVNPARVDATTGKPIDYWARIRDKKQVHILQDNSTSSMIHFMPKFMQVNNISSEDVSFLTNDEIKSNQGAFVNGKVVKEADITCQNGYIHVLDGVNFPLDNLASVIARQPQFSIYSSLLDRFSYPQFVASVNDEYHRLYGGEDSVFVKRYFNSSGNHPLGDTSHPLDDGSTVATLLPYDPGWNQYSPAGSFQEDAAAMLVPTDAAMQDYLNKDGADLKARYGTWDKIPDNVVLPLLQNTMLTSLKASIPSQFASINNTASEPMGVVKADIDSVLWGCNGVIYQTNKVYVAPDYVSVYYPCVIRGDEKNDDGLYVMWFYIEQDSREKTENGTHPYTKDPVYVSTGKGFKSQLNNMGSKYSFIIPTNKALETYYDPVSYKREDAKGNSTAVSYLFKVNDAGSSVTAEAYSVDWNTLDDNKRGKIGSLAATDYQPTTVFRTGDVTNHLSDLLNSSFTANLFVPGQRFYQAQNGGPIVVQWSGVTSGTVTGVAGSFQYERGYYIPVTETFNKSEDGNGCSYIIGDEPLMSTFTSPYAALTDSLRKDDFGSFASLLASTDIVVEDDGSKHLTMDKALSNLNNYHYTIYVPTNASVDALVNGHKLPTSEDVEAISKALEEIADRSDAAKNDATLTDDERATKMAELRADSVYLLKQQKLMKEVISNFVNYHIQDNSVYVWGENHSNDVFETACLDTLTNRFVKLYVSYTLGGTLTVTDNVGNQRKVDDNKNNILTRQYYFASNTGGTLTDMKNASQIYSSSFVVLHQIDAPLESSANCYYDPAEYTNVQTVISRYPITGGTSSPTPIKRMRR